MNKVIKIERTYNHYNNEIYIKDPSPGKIVLDERRKEKGFSSNLCVFKKRLCCIVKLSEKTRPMLNQFINSISTLMILNFF